MLGAFSLILFDSCLLLPTDESIERNEGNVSSSQNLFILKSWLYTFNAIRSGFLVTIRFD
jgi:hypothetical protein